MHTSVSFFQAEYINGIVKLINDNADYDRFGKKTTVKEFVQFLDAPGEEIRENTFVVRAGEQIIAYQSLCFVKGDKHINVYSYGTVHFHFKRKGIGSLLLEYTIKQLHDRAMKEKKKIIYNHMVRAHITGQDELARKYNLRKTTDLLSYMYTNLSEYKQVILPQGYSFTVPTIEDADNWALIYNEAFSWRKNKDGMKKENVVYEFGSTEFSPDFYILCINEIREPVGFISGLIENQKEGVIHTLAVRRQFQGMGIGKALLHEIINRMSGQVIEHIRLTVDVNNPSSAIHLYEKTGFSRDKQIIQYVYEINQRSNRI